MRTAPALPYGVFWTFYEVQGFLSRMNLHTMTPELQVRRGVTEALAAGDCLAAFATLLDRVPVVEEHPGLWEMVARRARALGATAVLQQIQMRLWDAGLRTTETALDLARYAQDANRPRRVCYFIEQGFGADPEDKEARVLLARAVLKDDPKRCLKLLGAADVFDIDVLLLRLDALRACDALAEARHLAETARSRHPNDTRLQARLARLQESLGDWDSALETLGELTLSDKPSVAEDACLRRVRLLLRLRRTDRALSEAANGLAASVDPLQRLLLMDLVGVDRAAALQVAQLCGSSWLSERDNQISLARVLRDMGRLGILIWLMEQGSLPEAAVMRDRLVAIVPRGTRREVASLNAVEAFARRSDGILWPIPFPVALAAHESMSRGRTTLDHLLVNATLAAGGAERQFALLTKTLCEMHGKTGTAVALFSQNHDRGHRHFRDEIDALDVKVHAMDTVTSDQPDMPEVVRHWVSLLPRPLRSDVAQLLGLCQQFRPRVLNGWQDRSSFAAGLVGTLLGVPRVVLSMRNMQPGSRGAQVFYAQSLLQYLSRLPHIRMTANSAAGARDYETWLGLRHGYMSILSNTLDETRFPLTAPARHIRRPASQRSLKVGGVFRLALNKRPGLWLQTVAALGEQWPDGALPQLVGNGPLKAQTEAMARNLGFGDFALRGGLQSPGEIYGGMDVLLLMSAVEGIPNVVLEAQLMGLPVVACDVGGTAEAVATEGGLGLLLAPDISAEAAAEQIVDWLPGVRGRKSARQRRAFVLSRFGRATFDRRLAELYSVA